MQQWQIRLFFTVSVLILGGCSDSVELACKAGPEAFTVVIKPSGAYINGGPHDGFYQNEMSDDVFQIESMISRVVERYEDRYWFQEQLTADYGTAISANWQISIDRRSLVVEGYYDPTGGRVDNTTRFAGSCREQKRRI